MVIMFMVIRLMMVRTMVIRLVMVRTMVIRPVMRRRRRPVFMVVRTVIVITVIYQHAPAHKSQGGHGNDSGIK